MTQSWNALLADLDALSPEELLRLSSSGSDAEEAALASARSTAISVARETGFGGELETAEQAVARWAQVGGARAGVMALAQPPSDLLLADLRANAARAVLDALLAELLADRLPDEVRATLAARWRQLRTDR